MPTYHKLSDQQILEKLFQTVTGHHRNLDQTFHNQRNLYALLRQQTHDQDFQNNPKFATTWDLIREIYYRSNKESLPYLDQITDIKQLHDNLKNYFHGQNYESTVIIAVDSAQHVIDNYNITIGNSSSVDIDPPAVVQWALNNHAKGLIIAHNHPNNEVDPSPDDIEVCRSLQSSLNLLGILLVDSLIVGDNDIYSMAKHHDIQ